MGWTAGVHFLVGAMMIFFSLGHRLGVTKQPQRESYYSLPSNAEINQE
jgi:hypothetical protein